MKLKMPSIVDEWLELLLRIRELSNSNLSSETADSDRGFSWFSQSLQANVGIVT
jgi:hypothetical protein